MGPVPRRGALVLAVALALALAGCGGSDGDGSTETSSSNQGSTRGSDGSSAEGQKGGEASIEEFGSEAEGSERAEILATFTGYLEAIAGKDSATACSYLSATVSESLAQLAGKGSKASCAVLLPKILAPTAGQTARQQAEGKVSGVRVEGDRAFVVFKAPGAKLYQQTMVKEGGEWKVATVAASVLVPEL